MSTLALSDLDYLLPKTKQVLLELSKLDWLTDFTFVGGSGLSLYLHHRLSEDIDLFTWKKELNKEEIIISLQHTFKDRLQIRSNGEKQIDLQIDQVQVTFFANDWEALKDQENLCDNLMVAKLDLLAAMKLNTLFLRAKFRDYYDLYALNKVGYGITRMYEIISNVMPGINKRLFQMAITYTADIEEDNIAHLEPKYAVLKEDIRQHFEKLVFEWLGEGK